MTITNAEAERAAERYLELKEQIETLTTELDGLKVKLRPMGEGPHKVGDREVVISPNRRFDIDAAKTILDPQQYDALCTAFDTKKAKQTLPPALYEACMSPAGDARVVVK